MKRISLFLLVFALTGGALFAQLGFSGSLNLGTKIDLTKGQDNYDNKYVRKDTEVHSSYNDFSYEDGPLSLSFGLGFNEDPDTNDDVYLWNYIGAKYANEDYGFSMGFTHHLEGGMDLMEVLGGNLNSGNEAQKMVFEFWETYGWYNFLGGDLELRVAKKGGQPYWWRAASVVLEAYEAWDDGGIYGDGSQAFEANEDGGIWLNYTGVRDLAFGVRLRDPFDEVGLGNQNYDFNNTPAQYFKDMTIGGKYDTGNWGVSLMTNLRNNKAYAIWTDGDGTLWDAFTADLYAGFNFKIMDGFWVYADFTAYEVHSFGKNDWWIGEPVFNSGLGASYEGPVNASLTFMVLDFSSAVGKTYVRQGDWDKKYKDSMEMDLFVSGSWEGDTLNAGIEINVYDLADNFYYAERLFTTEDWGGGTSLHINPYFGWQIVKDKLRADLGAGWTKGLGADNDKYQLFRVNPSFTVSPAGGANIVLSYYFEYDTDAKEFNDHNIGIGFNWSF
jgi:hypothetical protein